MKKLVYMMILLSLASCTKDLDLTYEKSDQSIVVNCLFSENENWKVVLTRIKEYADQNESFVDDAKVIIVPENSDSIYLNYSANGIYQAEEKPISGISYQLIVRAKDSKIISAKSSIPVTPVISAINPGTEKTIYFSNPNLSDYQVLPLNFKISGNENQNFVRFRLRTFRTDMGYTRYSVTKTTISELREEKFPEDFVSELEKLIGVSMNSYDYWTIISEIAKKYIPPYNGIDITSKLKKIKVTTRYDDAFQSGYLFSNSIGLNNVSKDIWNVLGEYRGLKEVSLLVSYIPVMNKNDRTDYKEEYWLEVTAMSEDYYNYQKSYIKQVNNLNNPFSSVIEVHSNIQNGQGIFAGYNRQMIHFYDY
jgi:uncharacterized protein YfcZ (UPF0381/DUF406 family)